MEIDQSTLKRTCAESMLDNLNYLRANQVLTDVILECADEQFHVHRVVLSAGSPYFRAMFSNGMCETNSNTVNLKGMDPLMLHYVLDFMYCGSIPITSDVMHWLSLLSLTDMLMVSVLHQQCWTQLLHLLNCDNFAPILEAAILYVEDSVLVKLASYFAVNVTQIQNTQSFLDLSAETLSALVENFSSNTLFTQQRNNLIEIAVHNWLCAAPKKRDRNQLQLLRFAKQEVNEDISATEHSFEETCTCEDTRSIRKLLFMQNVDANTAIAQSYNIKQNCWLPPKNVPCSIPERATVVQCGLFVYIVGGQDKASFTTANVFAYDYQSNLVWRVKSMNAPRQYCGAAASKDLLYVVGGWNDGRYTRTAECYLSTHNGWKEMSPTIHELISPKVVATRGHVFVVGSSQYAPVIEQYQTLSRQWSIITSIPNVSLCVLPLVAAGWGKIYVKNKTDDANIEVYDCDRQHWVEEQLIGLPGNVDRMWACENDSMFTGTLLFSHPDQSVFSVQADSKKVRTLTSFSVTNPCNSMFVVLIQL